MATMPAIAPAGQTDAAQAWFGAPAGLAVLAAEAEVVEEALASRPGLPWLWLAPLPALPDVPPGWGLRLVPGEEGHSGQLRCGLPLPLASGSLGAIVLQHPPLAQVDAGLLDECARLLVEGARLWLFALNPLSPYRARWQGGLRSHEPVTWRRKLRQAGLVPGAVAEGLGPRFRIDAAVPRQAGAGVRAAYALQAEKRRIPMTPVREAQRVRLERPATEGWMRNGHACGVVAGRGGGGQR